MFYSGKLLACELYDSMGKARTSVREVWEERHSRHPGHCIATNAHWFDPGPKQCGNYKVDGIVLSNQWPNALTGFGWNTGAPQWTSHMDNYNNFVCTMPALINGVRQNMDYGAGVERATMRTWFGRKGDEWSVEVTTSNYTLDSIVDRMAGLGITDGMVFDGSGSSQLYDGTTHITGDGRTIYSYLLCWFEDKEDDKPVDDMFYKRGIDVAEYQGEIDWEAVKASGKVDFVMIKCGSGQSGTDPYFKRNADECTRLGIPFGVYFFAYAYTVDLAKKEAKRCLELIKPYKLAYPVAWDYEYDSYNNAVKVGVTPTRTLVSNMARAFLSEIEAAGYYAMLYANPDYISRFFDSALIQRYDIWLAQWQGNNKKPEDKPAQAGGMWQYSNQGNNGYDVPGVPARVDLDYAYYDYPKLIGYTPTPVEPEPEPEPDPEEPPMTYEEEKAAATEWAKIKNISDGTRPYDPVQRVELWVTLWRLMGGEK